MQKDWAVYQAKKLVLNARKQLAQLYQETNKPSNPTSSMIQAHRRHGARLLRLQETKNQL